MSYQSTGSKPKKQASNHRSKELGDPIQNTPNECDVPAKEGTKCNSRVHVPTGNVCTNWNSHEQSKAMS